MALPLALQTAIESETSRFSEREMLKASEALSSHYRQEQFSFSSDAMRTAYLAARLPATFGAITHVLKQLPENSFTSLLDLGAGPGTGMWAVCEQFPEITQVTLVEKDASLSLLGRRISSQSPLKAIKQAHWLIQDLEQEQPFNPHDLLLFSYSLGELQPTSAARCIEKAWHAASKMVILIEPGTPAGFERIRTFRNQLIALGGHMVAPCPHHEACPMAGGDWCHFAQRVERSSLHRKLKSGSLGYEDEKFSYIAFSKTPCTLPQARILRHPLKRKGHVMLTLCTREGLKQETISKKRSDLYKQARDAEWGDTF